MYRIIYKSTATKPVNKENLRDILYASMSRNRTQRVNGVLVATRHHFLQFLEGSHELVEETYRLIEKDSRHCDILLVCAREIQSPRFTNWKMKGVGIFDLNLEIEKKLIEEFGEIDGNLDLPEEEQEAYRLLDYFDL